MRVEQHVYETLQSLASGRVYPVQLPQETAYPAIVISRIGGASEYGLSGANATVQARVQIDCWAETFGGTMDLSSSVKTAMNGIRSHLLLERHDRETTELNSRTATLYRAMLDYHIWFTES